MRAQSLAFAFCVSAFLLNGCDSGESTLADDRMRAAPAPVVSRPASAPAQVEQRPAPGRSREVAIAGGEGQPAISLKDGRLLPLARIMEIARQHVPGEVIEVELDDDDDPEYELEILTADGRSIDMKIDARRGAVLGIEED